LELGDELLNAAQNLSYAALSVFLVAWRAQLREELSTNKSQVLSSRAFAAANAIGEDFPDINVVLQYAKPVTSLSHPEIRPDPSTWVPRLPRLAELACLCHNTFSWDAASIVKSFHNKVWPVCCIQRLSQTSPVSISSHILLLLKDNATFQSGCLP
jgi:holliday junction resolvase YEN1